MPRRFNVLVVDDEPLARRTLRDFIGGTAWIGEVREASDGLEAVAQIDSWRPDLVFLDIAMPGLTGLEVLERISARSHVIFATAYDQYAVTAFELQALDYLLKPFGRARVQAVLERARRALEANDTTGLDRAREGLSTTPVSRLFLKDGARIVKVDVEAVEHVEGCDDYVAVYANGRRLLVQLRLQDVERVLNAEQFIRIHRSHIINLAFAVAFEPYDAWRLEVVLKNGQRIVASRAGTQRLRELPLRSK